MIIYRVETTFLYSKIVYMNLKYQRMIDKKQLCPSSNVNLRWHHIPNRFQRRLETNDNYAAIRKFFTCWQNANFSSFLLSFMRIVPWQQYENTRVSLIFSSMNIMTTSNKPVSMEANGMKQMTCVTCFFMKTPTYLHSDSIYNYQKLVNFSRYLTLIV